MNKDATEAIKSKQTRKRDLKSAEELAALWKKGIDIWIVVAELAALWRVKSGCVYLKIHTRTLEIPVTYYGTSPRFRLGDAMRYIETAPAKPVRRRPIHGGAEAL